MHCLIPILCLTTIGITMSAHTGSKRKKHARSSLDVDSFFDKLLSSDKFEKFADLIAEKAADKIISLQGGTKRHGHNFHDIPAENKRAHNKMDSNYKLPSYTFNKTSESHESDKEKEVKEKINPDAFTEHEASSLSLKFRHYTTAISKDMSEGTTASIKTKFTTQQAHTIKDTIDKGSASSGETAEENNSNNQTYLRKPMKKKSKQMSKTHQIKADASKNNTTYSSASGSLSSSDESTASGSYSSELVGEERNATGTKTHKVSKITLKAAKPIGRQGNSRESDISKIDSEYVDKTTAVLRDRDNADLDKSARFSDDSDDNDLGGSGSYEQNGITHSRHNKAESAEENTVTNKMSIEATEQPVKEAQDKSPIDKMDLKHKVRTQNGKQYAFAQHPSYEEYHEQVKEMLKSVQENNTGARKDEVNLDLLDLVQ